MEDFTCSDQKAKKTICGSEFIILCDLIFYFMFKAMSNYLSPFQPSMPQIKGPKLIYQYLKKTNTLECQHILVPTISIYQWEKLFLTRTLSHIEHASISHKFCGAQRCMYSVEHSNSKCHALMIHPNTCTQYSSRNIKRGT